MARRHASLGHAELEILRYVADHHPISVRQVAEHAAETKGLARTTVLTVMERLRKKGFLIRKRIEGVYCYGPKLPKGELLRDLTHDFVQTVLEGSLSPFMAYLAETENLSDKELAKLKQLVRDLDTRRKGDSS
ncbi:MAG: BlaI/MecI/CopY family transcriptional regulator [Planctomycetota bacterium]|jgi:predicted transcriptional regulator